MAVGTATPLPKNFPLPPEVMSHEAVTNTAMAHASSFPPIMMFPMVIVAGIAIAYLLGSIPFGVLLAKFYKIGDLRKTGSGNIGATNMLRAGGKKLAAATLFLDMFKGWLAVFIGTWLVTHYLAGVSMTSGDGIHFDVSVYIYFFGLWAVIGHVYPLWLRGKGGKGVATALGVLLGFSLPVGMLVMSCWLVVFAASMYSSLAALVSISLAPFICAYLIGKAPAMACTIISAIVIFRHKDNIQRLLNGSESKSDLGKSSKSERP